MFYIFIEITHTHKSSQVISGLMNKYSSAKVKDLIKQFVETISKAIVVEAIIYRV